MNILKLFRSAGGGNLSVEDPERGVIESQRAHLITARCQFQCLARVAEVSSSEDGSSGDVRRVVVVVLPPPGAGQPAVAGGARQCRRQPRPGDRHGLQGQQHGRRLQVGLSALVLTTTLPPCFLLLFR